MVDWADERAAALWYQFDAAKTIAEEKNVLAAALRAVKKEQLEADCAAVCIYCRGERYPGSVLRDFGREGTPDALDQNVRHFGWQHEFLDKQGRDRYAPCRADSIRAALATDAPEQEKAG